MSGPEIIIRGGDRNNIMMLDPQTGAMQAVEYVRGSKTIPLDKVRLEKLSGLKLAEKGMTIIEALRYLYDNGFEIIRAVPDPNSEHWSIVMIDWRERQGPRFMPIEFEVDQNLDTGKVEKADLTEKADEWG